MLQNRNEDDEEEKMHKEHEEEDNIESLSSGRVEEWG